MARARMPASGGGGRRCYKLEGGEEGEECAICLINLDVEGREELPCRHVYHAECLAGWRGTCAAKNLVQACPYCRAVFE